MDRCVRCFGDLDDLAVFCPHCAQAHEPVFDRLIDFTIDGRYRLYRRLSQGGLSSVFAATDLQTDSVVVIKISDPAQLVRRESSYAIDREDAKRYWAEMLERMRREVEHLTRIDHPNIVRFLGTGTVNEDLRYVALEFLHGQTLKSEIDARGRYEIEAGLDVLRQISDALQAIHQRNIVHRDINPGNIILCAPMRIKLIDFGIAKFPQPAGAPPFTRNSSLRGTVSYSSPEQCQGLEVDRRSDIYSLAVLCYEMLTGKRPFDGRTPTEIALKHIQALPPEPRSINPDIPAGMNIAMLRALSKNPDDRPETVTQFLHELESGRSQFTVSLRPYNSDPEPARVSSTIEDSTDRVRLARKRRRRSAVAGGALLLALTVGGLLLASQILSHKQTPEDMAVSTGQNQPIAAQPDGEMVDFIPGSDADSLEIGASSSQLKDFRTSAPFQIRTAPIITARPVKSFARTTNSHQKKDQKAASKTVTINRPAASRPKSPPMPAPTVTARQIPPPSSLPDTSQSPRRETARNKPIENTTVENQPLPQDRSTEDRQRETVQKVEPPEHHRDEQVVVNRPPTDSIEPVRRTTKPTTSKPAAGNIPQVGPKLIQWAGSVNRVREVRIEMPGIPGTIDIPRVYRDRVGVVEPPNTGNDWKYAVLRVFGRGEVSFLIRWWPVPQNQIAEFK